MSPQVEILATSVMARIAEPSHQAIFEAIGEIAGRRIEVVTDGTWGERMQRVDTGEIGLAFLCGYPYGPRSSLLTILAAPVMAAPRYGGQPVYFSDVITRRDAGLSGFADLAGKRWGYNETESQSGYNCVRTFLSQLGLDLSYFGEVVETGSHAESMRLIEAGVIDGAAIDSTVLEMELRRDPSRDFKIIETIGPSPIPPLVANRALPGLPELRAAALALADTSTGRAALALGMMARMVEVDEASYLALHAP